LADVVLVVSLILSRWMLRMRNDRSSRWQMVKSGKRQRIKTRKRNGVLLLRGLKVHRTFHIKQQLLCTQWDEGNAIGIHFGWGYPSLALQDKALAVVDEKCPRNNIGYCMLLGSSGSAEKTKIERLHILADEITTYLYTICTISNKADQIDEKVKLAVTDAENELNLFLVVLERFYSESKDGSHLKSITT